MRNSAQSPDDAPDAHKAVPEVEQISHSSNLASMTDEKLKLTSPSFSAQPQDVDEDDPMTLSAQKSTAKGLVPTGEDTNALLPISEKQNELQTTIPTTDSLVALVKSVPAKTLHAYILSRIPKADESTLTTLAAFLKSLEPPPQLHCVRCHKDYVEVENTDRSCLVAHDDESAEVERVGKLSDTRRTVEGASYETLWGCCGKITEGDGSHGPPDGWCYEGLHTVSPDGVLLMHKLTVCLQGDIKRARFRADSTVQDDKLVSCLRLNCHNIRDKLPRSSTRLQKKKARTADAEEEDESSEGASDSGIEEITGVKNSARKARSSTASASQSARGGARRPGRPRKHITDEHGTPVKRPRGRPRKHPLPQTVSPEQPIASTSSAVLPPVSAPESQQSMPQSSVTSVSFTPPITPGPASTSKKKPKSTPKSATQPAFVPATPSPAPPGPLVLVQENPDSAPVLMLQQMPYHAHMPTYLYTPPQGAASSTTPNQDDSQNASSAAPGNSAPPSSRSKSRRKVKSAEYIEDSDVEMAAASPTAAPGKTAVATPSGSVKRRRGGSDADGVKGASAEDGLVKKRKV